MMIRKKCRNEWLPLAVLTLVSLATVVSGASSPFVSDPYPNAYGYYTMGLWHLDEQPSDDAVTIVDSSSFGRNLTQDAGTGTANGSLGVSAQTGFGTAYAPFASYDFTEKKLYRDQQSDPTPLIFGDSSFRIDAWVKNPGARDSYETDRQILSISGGWGTHMSFGYNVPSGQLYLKTVPNSTAVEDLGVSNQNLRSDALTWESDTWYLVTLDAKLSKSTDTYTITFYQTPGDTETPIAVGTQQMAAAEFTTYIRYYGSDYHTYQYISAAGGVNGASPISFIGNIDEIRIQAIPEPCSAILFSGCAVLLIRRRRRAEVPGNTK